MSSRPVITGLGVASPLGVGREAAWQSILKGDRGLAAPPAQTDGVPRSERAHVFPSFFPAEEYVDRRAVRKLSDLARLAVVAGRFCLEDAGIPDGAEVRREVQTVFGTCFGSSTYHLEYHEALRSRGLDKASALLFTESVFNAPSAHLSGHFGLRGANLTLVGGEAVGLQALITAHDRIRLGARAVLAGGGEQYGDRVEASCRAANLTGMEPSTAFGSEPGTMAEGAVCLFVEPAEKAASAGYARLLGVGHVRPGARDASVETMREAVNEALEMGACRHEEVDLVVSSASGGPTARREKALLEAVFRETPIVAPKGPIGEGFGYTSALLPFVGALLLSTGEKPPLLEAGNRLAANGPDAIEYVLVLATTRAGACLCALLGAPVGD